MCLQFFVELPFTGTLRTDLLYAYRYDEWFRGVSKCC